MIDVYLLKYYKYYSHAAQYNCTYLVRPTLRSLCTTPLEWQWLTDSRICWMQCEASASE